MMMGWAIAGWCFAGYLLARGISAAWTREPYACAGFILGAMGFALLAFHWYFKSAA